MIGLLHEDHDLCSVVIIITGVMVTIMLMMMAWAMTAWVRMIRAMKAARIEYELAALALGERPESVPPPIPTNDGL